MSPLLAAAGVAAVVDWFALATRRRRIVAQAPDGDAHGAGNQRSASSVRRAVTTHGNTAAAARRPSLRNHRRDRR